MRRLLIFTPAYKLDPTAKWGGYCSAEVLEPDVRVIK